MWILLYSVPNSYSFCLNHIFVVFVANVLVMEVIETYLTIAELCIVSFQIYL
jgi:hypothetical protein